MKLKKYAISLAMISVLGIGVATNIASADESNNVTMERRSDCKLTEEEKEVFDKYYRQPKRDLTTEERDEYFDAHDKVYQYMDEDFTNKMQEKRENCNNTDRGNGNCDGQGQGRRQGQCRGINQ